MEWRILEFGVGTYKALYVIDDGCTPQKLIAMFYGKEGKANAKLLIDAKKKIDTALMPIVKKKAVKK